MKLEIAGATPPEKTVELYLEKGADGIYVRARFAGGSPSPLNRILRVNNNGTYKALPGISDDFGFKLNSNKVIVQEL